MLGRLCVAPASGRLAGLLASLPTEVCASWRALVVQVGVANIREYEDRHLHAAETANQERAKLKMQVSRHAVGAGCVDHPLSA